MKLSILIPVFNEESTIEEIIKKIKDVEFDGIEKEIIAVDDGSTDGTRLILERVPGIKVFFHGKNLGKGAAIKTGLKAASGQIVLFQDADLEYDPRDYQALIQPIIDKKAEAVLGVRKRLNAVMSRKKPHYWVTVLGNALITQMTNWLYWNNALEYEGGYKVFTKRIIDSVPVETDSFDYDNELVCKILRRGRKTADVLISYSPRDYSEGKKIKLRHGLKILWTIFKWRFLNF